MIDESARRTLSRLIKRHRFAMLTTIEEDEMLRRSLLCASYSEPKDSEFVCVSGDGSLVEDSFKKKGLWNSVVQAWFPEGPDSTSNLLMKLTPIHAEYWDSSSSKLV
jgi:general stress protein 26